MFNKAPLPSPNPPTFSNKESAKAPFLSLSSPNTITLNQQTYITGVLNVHATVTGLKVRAGCCSSAVWPPTKAFPLCVLVLYGDYDIRLIE